MAAKIEGGWLGSRKGRVRTELKEHYQSNKIIRHARHNNLRRMLGWLVVGRSVLEVLVIYGLFLSATLALEVSAACQRRSLLPALGGDTLLGLLKDFAGFFLAAQVGILAIVAVAVGIVTFIIQDNDGPGTTSNIRLYYSEGFAYELTRSGVALLLVLIGQLFWPIHHIVHALGLGANDLQFEVLLTLIHSASSVSS